MTMTGVAPIVRVAAIFAIFTLCSVMCAECSDDVAVCATPECAETASRILRNMNEDIAPCEDFYNFACGGYIDATAIPDGESVVNVTSELEKVFVERVRAILEERSRSDEPKFFAIAKNLYRSCMNETAIEAAGTEPLLNVLDALGSWPVLEGDNWREDGFDWLESIYKLPSLGYLPGYLIGYDLFPDLLNESTRVISLDQPYLGLAREYLLEGSGNQVVQAYFDFMVDMAVILGASEETATAELRQVLEFETKMANITMTPEERVDFTLLYEPFTIAQLNQRFPSIDWLEYVNNLLIPSVPADQDEVVVVFASNYIDGILALLNATSKRVQSNYLLWRVVLSSVRRMNREITERTYEYYDVLDGVTERKPRWEVCMDLVVVTKPLVVGGIYASKYFDREAKNATVEIFEKVRAVATTLLDQAVWMDGESKSAALEKIAALYPYIGFPDLYFDEQALDEYYASLYFAPDDAFGNARRDARFNMMIAAVNLRKPFPKRDWSDGGNVVLGVEYYNVLWQNSIVFRAGGLRGALFDKDRPRSLNYGAVGQLIAREIWFGFNDYGALYDPEGNQKDWWTAETRAAYTSVATCVRYQYGNYTDESANLTLNGCDTEPENIADVNGVKAAYLAYVESIEEDGNDTRLPGLNYSSKQLFWIGAANAWCTKYTPEALKALIETGSTSPARFRVIGPFSDRPEFAADFDCPAGSAMNPAARCTVW